MRALTVRQPHASLIVAGIKPAENRSWPVPSTLPQWGRCSGCHNRVPPTSRIATDHQPIHRPGEQLHRRLPPNPPEACGPIEWDDGPFPFILVIHAAKADTDNDPTIPKMAWDALGEVIGGAAPPRGVLLGYVTVTGCHKAYECMDPSNGSLCSPWADWRPRDRPFHALWHWTLASPVALDEPVPMRGRQGLWTVPDDVVAEVAA